MAQEKLGIQSGLLFANPISPKFSIPKADIDLAISQAVAEAEEKGIRGHANTPFILERIKDLTAGTSVAANRSLVSTNVELAARIARNLSRLGRKSQDTLYTYRVPLNTAAAKDNSISVLGTAHATTDTIDDSQIHTLKPSSTLQPPFSPQASYINPESPINSLSSAPILNQNAQASEQVPLLNPAILVVGSVAIDLACDYTSPTSPSSNTEIATTPEFHTSNPAAITSSIGGVGHNVALAAQYASKRNSVLLCSFVGNDL